MNEKVADKIRLSGKVAGTRYRFGVSNPYNGRTTVELSDLHLQALRAFVTFVDLKQLEQPVVIEEMDFEKHFPVGGGLGLLKNVLLGWVKIENECCRAISTFAEVTFYENPNSRRMIVRLNEYVVDLLHKLDGAASSRTGD